MQVLENNAPCKCRYIPQLTQYCFYSGYQLHYTAKVLCLLHNITLYFYSVTACYLQLCLPNTLQRQCPNCLARVPWPEATT